MFDAEPNGAAPVAGGPVRDWPASRVHEAFEALADRQPSAPAVVADDDPLDYRALESRANALARALIARGVRPGDAVGVLVARSAALPQTYLAILKAGAVYVPMVADLPAERLADMAGQAALRAVVALDGLAVPDVLRAAIPARTVVRPEDLPEDLGIDLAADRPRMPGRPDDLAAILFTSGSTGRPKGVELTHAAAINMALGHIEAHGIGPGDRVLLATSPGFILGFRELHLPLLSGAAFVPVSRAELDDPPAVLAIMARHRVAVALFTPSYLRLFRGAVPEGLRCLITAGERPHAGDARHYARHLAYWNVHGTTEVCGTICMSRVDPDGTGPLLSGRPFANTAVHLLDAGGREVAAGAVGEVHVTGAGLARGYLGQPELTAERFVDTPFGRAYRTHDLGRWTDDGRLETLGRADDMVKVSGQSVSLGEIERTLVRHDAVDHAAAFLHRGRLVAVVATRVSDPPTTDAWRAFLGRTLPDYMLPAHVARVAGMPLNSAGKADRQALLAVIDGALAEAHATGPDGAPRTETERDVAGVWERVLKTEPVGRDDDFFALGGTSLLAIAVGQGLRALGYSLSPQAVLAAPSVAALAATIDATAPAASDPFADTADTGPATVGQEEFWIAWKLGAPQAGTLITRVLTVTGPQPEPARWRAAWQHLIARHAALRTAFFADDTGRVHWRTVAAEEVSRDGQFTIESCDTLAAARERLDARFAHPMALTEPPLARAGLVRVAEGTGQTLFWFALHHAVIDGLSARLVQEDLFALLLGHDLPPAANGIALAARLERDALESDAAGADLAFWRDGLDAAAGTAGPGVFADLGADRRRPATPGGTAAPPVVERLDAATVAALTRVARARRVGVHGLLLGLLGAEARRRTGRAAVVIGSGVSTRPAGAETAAGYFVNLLPLVFGESPAAPLADHLRAAQDAIGAAVTHAGCPAGLITRAFRERHPDARPPGRAQLFDLSLTANPSRACRDAASGLALTPCRLPGATAHPAAGIDLAFHHEPLEDGGLELVLTWNPEAYREETARAWLAGFAGWARWLAADGERAAAPRPPLLPAEAELLARWEGGPAVERPARRFHELFAEQAAREPDRLAVAGGTAPWSRARVMDRAGALARALVDRGVGRQETVAVLTEASATLPAVVLGIWEAGAVYLPLALDQPPERLAYMARDAGARVLVVPDGHPVPDALAAAVTAVVRPESLADGALAGGALAGGAPSPRVAGTPRDRAYIIYTSGTTGLPKGVAIRHDNLINAILMTGEAIGFRSGDRVALVATPGFDASLWELGLGLLLGMPLVPISQALRDDPWALKNWYAEQGVTVAFHAPSYLRISRETPFRGLRVLITGGEAPSHDDLAAHAGPIEFWNAYGPTETTIIVTLTRLGLDADPDRPLPTGGPLSNMRIAIRRDDGTPVPPGAIGEVWLGGAGVGEGYLNRPELTAKSFVDTAEGRFYRTGDRGRWTADGRLELGGRIDHQVKLHGQRLELDEIEQVLRTHPAVRQAVVLVDQAAHHTLALRAFVRLGGGGEAPDGAGWRAWLSERLPPYMIPAGVLVVTAVPVTPSGKVDRGALLNIAAAASDDAAAAGTPPQGEPENRIAAVWEDLLGTPVCREDNFFALGGNSLLAVTAAHRLAQELGRAVAARELFAAPTLAGFAERIARSAPAAATAVPAHTDRATEGEREFWTAEAAGLDTRTFTIPVYRAVRGAVPPPARWDAAWAALVARHQALRTHYHEDPDGRLCRRVAASLDIGLDHASCADRAAVRVHIRDRQSAPLPMGTVPLWRAGVVTAADTGEAFFWLALHHAVGDGHSVGILMHELATLLHGGALPPLHAGFGESAAAHAAYLAGPACAVDAAYWRRILAPVPDTAFAEWPLDIPRGRVGEVGSHRFQVRLEPDAAAGLRTLARRHAASLHATVLTLLGLEVRRRTGRADVVLGTTASNRERAAENHVVGDYVNMLPLPVRLPASAAFGALVREIQAALAGALQHARYPFARLYHDVWTARPHLRHPARYPLFDIAVTENPAPATDAAPVLARPVTADGAVDYERTGWSPGQDMVLIHEDQADGGLVLQWHVNAALYRRDTAEAWFTGLAGWARWLGRDPARAEAPLPPLLPDEAARLAGWERGPVIGRPALRLHQMVERIADRHGDRPAVVTADAVLSYRDLDRAADAIAHALIARGAGPGTTVAVLAERSPNLPAAVLGVWKAGATYLPLAADLPPERLAFMAGDSGAGPLIALDGVPVPAALAGDLAEPLRPEALATTAPASRPTVVGTPEDTAYILYTSGSTGRPKGTRIGHDAYVNLVLGVVEAFGLGPEDRTLMFSSPSFDVSLSDIGVPLAAGAALCPVPFEVIGSPARLRALMSERQVTVADLTPTYLRLFAGAELPTVRILVTGGEAPFRDDVRTYAARHRYYNAYGPTENTITSTMGVLAPDGAINGAINGDGALPCGRPLPNTIVEIRDDNGRPVAPGVTGEVWLGGRGLAQGYVNRPEQTAAAFVGHGESRRYRTGDLGRWRTDGTLEVLGRRDDQVKLNGIRVELGEIEHALVSHPDVAQAVVAVEHGDDRSHRLWAFVRPAPGRTAPPNDAWGRYLADRLPAYMVPAAVVAVDAIPLTHSGKVDKAALKARLGERMAEGGGRTPPGDDTERRIASVWAERLGHRPICREDHFFALGGHSLLAIAVAHDLETALGRPVSARDLFAAPTLAGFADRVRQAGIAVETPAHSASDRATEGQREFWIAEQAGLDTRGFNISLSLAVGGAVPPAAAWVAAWAALVARHPALRTFFHEDGDGILRRGTVPRLDQGLEIVRRPDRAAARAHALAGQGEPFAMAAAPLWRAGLVEIDEGGEAVFWLSLHHSVGDGWSLGVLVDELGALLRGETLPPPPAAFDRSAAREAAYLESPDSEADRAYWRDVLSDLGGGGDEPDPFDEWPLDAPRPAGRTARHGRGSHCWRMRLDAATAEGLRALARGNGASLHALMLTMMAIEVRRRTGRPGFVLGTAASMRDRAAEAAVVGYYVNMLPVPCTVGRDAPLAETLRTVQATMAAGLQHQRYPFARINRDFRAARPQAVHPARHPLFDLAVTENPGVGAAAPAGAWRFGPLDAAADDGGPHYELRRNAPAQDMVLVHEGRADGGLDLLLFANAAVYEPGTARAWIESLAGWARSLADGTTPPDVPLPALQPSEAVWLANHQHGPSLALPDRSFPDRVHRLADAHPDRPAVVTDAGVRSFGEVNARADALARALVGRGVARGARVGVLTERSAALPETVLAVWKAGACYLPLAADLPAERLAFMADDAGVGLVVALDGLGVPDAMTEGGRPVLRPEAVAVPETVSGPLPDIDAADPAYVIYTSGSTGQPKGVVLSHDGLNNLAAALAEALGIVAGDRALLMASPAFDAWISDLVMAWAAGAAVVPVGRAEIDDIPGMHEKLARLAVSVATMPPSYLRLFDHAEFPGLRLLMTVGEPPVVRDARHYAARLACINGYGPTENTAAVSVGRIDPERATPTAGRPLANVSVHLLDAAGRPVPPGAVGRVWLSGRSLALGYLNRPDKTAEVFVDTPDGRRYDTGDLGRWTADGELAILGRADTQVKLRGQRVELGEIEHRLGAHPGVRQAVALVETGADGTRTLWGFVRLAAAAAAPTQADWHAFLSETLPSYMIPAAVIAVPEIPLGTAGKVDRAALLRRAAELGALETAAGGEAGAGRTRPRTAIETRIAEIWAEQFPGRTIAREDDFFALGGDSLRVIAVITRLRREFQCAINDLYEHPVLADFAGVCRHRPEHLHGLIDAVRTHWQSYRDGLAAYEAARDEALGHARQDYAARNRSYAERDLGGRRDYAHVLLTGATGYLGSYLLRELMAEPGRRVTALVRGGDDAAARARLGDVLGHYFGAEAGAALLNAPRLTVVAGDLRRDDLGLAAPTRDRLAETTRAVFHCAANVNHYGHYHEFHADNVAATGRLLALAAHRRADPADFHHVSTMSVAGRAPESGFHLFTEYDPPPAEPCENYYVRTKQDAERLVIAARGTLANACIHRVGNVVFAARDPVLQRGIDGNAFFRQLAAFIGLGRVPDDLHVWLCHVDELARALVLLAGSAGLGNETHHLEHARRDTIAELMGGAVETCDFGAFLDRLAVAVDQPAMARPLAETIESFGLTGGRAPQPRARRRDVVTGRTQALLARLGFAWPEVPAAGLARLLEAAAAHFSHETSQE